MRNPVSKIPGQPREPIWGSQAGSFFSQLAMLAAALCLVLAVLLLAVFAKDQTQRFLYGDPKPTAAYVAPGSYEWTPDKGLQPTH